MSPLLTLIYKQVMALSELTNLEYVTLVGHYNQIGEKSMEGQLLARDYSPEFIEKIKSKFITTPVKTVHSLNIEFRTNIEMNFIGFGYYFNLFQAYSENGVLPFSGCLADQPSKIMDIFGVFDQLKYEVEAKQIKDVNKRKAHR